MNSEQTKSAAEQVMGLLNIKKIPLDDNAKVNFSEEQLTELHSVLTEATTNQLIQAFEKENLKVEEAGSVKSKIDALLASTNLSSDEIEELANQEDGDMASKLDAIQKSQKEDSAKIAKLMESTEEDTPLEEITEKTKGPIMHSKTHLFSSKSAYNSFDGRNWNRSAAGLSTSATDWTDSTNVANLNGDLDLYFRENQSEIKSLFRDNFGLPSHWKKRTNIIDRIVSGTIVTAEITQGRKFPWFAKNNQSIQPEEGKIYPIQLDAEFIGYELQAYEASWISSYNKEGSQAYKWTFVRFLLSELDKKARQEDRVATIKGVFVQTPKTATKAGRFINRQNGYLYWLWKARNVDKKYRAFNLGTPNASNIVDYIDRFIKSLPSDVRYTLGLEMQLSKTLIENYKRRYEVLHAGNNNYVGNPDHPKDYSNIKFVPIEDFEGTDIIIVTPSDNVEILENVPKEKSKYTFELLKRIFYIFADYKLGIRLVHIGNRVKAGDPEEFKAQSVWTNNVPFFASDFFIPLFDNKTGVVTPDFNQLFVDEAWATDITSFEKITPGMVYKIKGNSSMAASKKVKDGAVISLVGDVDFDLQTGGTLTLLANSDNTLRELSRTTTAAVETSDLISFDADVIDAESGDEFQFSGSTDIAFDSIADGVEGQIVKILGKQGGGNTLTFNTANNINVNSVAVLSSESHYIKLVLVEGVWYESERLIA